MAKKSLKPVELDLDSPGSDLSRLFASSLSATPDVRRAISVSLERLSDNPYQPRTRVDEEALNELATVIKEHGFQGVLVAREDPEQRGFYQITAGHRRREAAKRAGLAAIPVVLEALDDQDMAALAITENIQREDLTPLEEGRIYLLMREKFNFTYELIAGKVGKSLGYVYNRARVAMAPEDIQSLVTAKPDSLRAVANLIKIESAEERAPLIQGLLAGTITTDDLPVYIEDMRRPEPDTRLEETSEYRQATTAKAPSTQEAADSQFARADVAVADHSTVLVNGVATPVERSQSPEASMTAMTANTDRAGASQIGSRPHKDDQDRRAGRLRRIKLKRIRGLLEAFAEEIEGGPGLAQGERSDLAVIAALSERLCVRMGIDKAANLPTGFLSRQK